MQPPELTPDEAQRLDAVRRLGLLDTAAEERFDRVTRLACRVFDVPIALVTLVDAERQWFKSAQGLFAQETPRTVSFCGHAILGDGAFVVPDASSDPRFADNPLVTGQPDIRFYAGQPIHSPDGRAVGTLCIIDRVARTLSAAETALLEDLGKLVEGELERGRMSEAQRLLREELDETQRRATVDALTRVWNREFIVSLFTRELDVMRRRGTPLSLCFIDVDHFKRVNDTYGHPVGDVVLRAVADRLRRSLRSDDAVGRYGGEEFLVILPATGAAEALAVAERVRAAVAQEPFESEAGPLPVTVSIGLCSTVDPGHGPEAIITAADDALYEAKRGGRNRVVAVSLPA